MPNLRIVIESRVAGEEPEISSHHLELFLGLQGALPDLEAVFVEQKYVSKFDVEGEVLEMFGIQENMAGVGCGCGVDDLEFETVVLFGIFSMRVSAVDDNSDCIKLASLGCGLALDIGQFGKCVLLVHNLFKYNFLFWARFEI